MMRKSFGILTLFTLGVLPLQLAAVGQAFGLPGLVRSSTVDLGSLALGLQLVRSGLDRPVAITHAADGSGRLFIVEQQGRVLIDDGTQLLSTPFLDISGLVSCCGNRGLLSIAFHPDYETNGFFYVKYVNAAGEVVVVRYTVSASPDLADPASAQVVLTLPTPPGDHYGGQLQFGPDGYLYIGVGDGGSGGNVVDTARDLSSLYGKMLRIDVDTASPYVIPPDNPFLGDPGAAHEIWALGLRNPWRFSFDRLTGDLYIADVGQSAFEEVNVQAVGSAGGEDYGWNIMEGADCYDALTCDTTGLVLPVAEYDHSAGCSVTGGHVYRGSDQPSLASVYFYGDFCSGRIWGLEHDGTDWQNALLLDTPYQISTFGEDEAGNVYLADYGTGDVYLLEDSIAEVIVDNLDSNTTSSGTWSISSGAGPWDGQSVYNNSGNFFRWLPTLTQAGTYKVYAWFTFHPNRSDAVPYRIQHADSLTVTEVIVDQSDASLAGKWHLLGTFPFDAGGSGYVEVSSDNGQASADAVRLEFVGSGPLPLSVITSSLAEGVVGQPYSETPMATGGALPYMWSVIDTLPTGLTLNATTGEISGTPAMVGTTNFTIEVEDDLGDTAQAMLSITVTVIVDNLDSNTTSSGTWSISSGENPWNGQSVYNNSGNFFRWLPTLTQAGTYEVYTWFTFHPNRSDQVPYRIQHADSLTETEVIVDQSDSSLAGKWHLLGTFPFDAGSSGYVEVSSDNGQASADAVRLEFVGSGPLPLSVTTSSLAEGVVGQSYSQTLMATGGTLPYMWSVMGTLPDGLTLNALAGEIAGTPTAADTTSFTVEVEDALGATAQTLLSITVAEPARETIVDNLDANTTSSGTWRISSGDDPWNGQSLYNNSGNFFRWLPSLPLAGTHEVYTWFTFHPNRSDAVPYRIQHAGGLTLTEVIVDQSDSSLAGKWHLLGTFPFDAGSSGYVEVSSANGQACADAVRLVFVGDQPLSIVNDSLPDGTVATTFSTRLIATGGAAPYSWSLISGNLPSGLALDAGSGDITGDPTWGETASFTVQLEDSALNAVTRDFSITISPFVGLDFGHPYIQNPTTDEMTVIWWTPVDRAGSLEYGIGGFDNSEPSSPEPVVLTRPGASSDLTRYKHQVRLSGLPSGTEFQYRVMQDDVVFESRFRTAPTEVLSPIRFLVWADTETQLSSHGTLGSGAPSGYPMDQNEGIMAGVLASSSLDPDFILIAGDIVEQAGRLNDWDELFRKINDRNPDFYSSQPPLASHIPIFAVPGNHDYYGAGFGQPGSEIHGMHKFIEHFDNPSNTLPTIIADPDWPSEQDPAVRAAQNERYFAVDYGPATVIAIDVNNQSPDDSSDDTNFNIVGENDPGGGFAPDWLPGSRQYQWLEEQLQMAQSRSLFTFVYWHHAPFSSGPHALPPGVNVQSGLPTRQLDELFHRYRVTAVFNGHEEMVEMSETRGDLELGGDPNHIIRYFIPGSMGDGIREELSNLLNPSQVFHYGDSAIGRHYGFLVVDIFPDPDDPNTWRATFRQAWIDPNWADDRSRDPLGGYYDTADPAAYFEAIRTLP